MKILYTMLLILVFSTASYAKEKAIDLEYFRQQGSDIQEFNDYYQIALKKESTIYYVTKPNHPAHPFYFEVKFVEENGHVVAKVFGEGTGDKTETAKMRDQIQAKIDSMTQGFK